MLKSLLRRAFVFVAILGVPANAMRSWADEQAPPARVLFNGQVFTAEPERPYAEAVAIRGGTIVAVGNLAEVSKAVPADSERIDLRGRTLFPGFIDSVIPT